MNQEYVLTQATNRLFNHVYTSWEPNGEDKAFLSEKFGHLRIFWESSLAPSENSAPYKFKALAKAKDVVGRYNYNREVAIANRDIMEKYNMCGGSKRCLGNKDEYEKAIEELNSLLNELQ